MAKHQPDVTEKPCRYCGQPIVWTRALARDWENIQFCDNACKRHYNRENWQETDDDGNLKSPSSHRPRRRQTA